MLVRGTCENESKHNTGFCFQTFRLALKRTVIDKKLETSFAMLLRWPPFVRSAESITLSAGAAHAPLRSAALLCAALRCPTLGCAPLRHAPLRHAQLRCAALCSAALRCAARRHALLRSATPPPYNTKSGAVREPPYSLFNIIKESQGGTC